MEDWQERSLALIGEEKMRRLRASHVLLFGLGGVGGFACEALARSGVGTLTLVDMDVYTLSNLNRQPGALLSTLGREKTEAMAEHIRAIRGESCGLRLFSEAVRPGEAEKFFTAEPCPIDLVIDAIDDLAAKLEIARLCAEKSLPLLICGGCGRRLDPGQLKLTDIAKSENDPLLKRLRRLFREAGIRGIQTLWSGENARKLPDAASGPSSMIFVPASAGLRLAARSVSHLIGEELLLPPRFFSGQAHSRREEKN